MFFFLFIPITFKMFSMSDLSANCLWLQTEPHVHKDNKSVVSHSATVNTEKRCYHLSAQQKPFIVSEGAVWEKHK